MFQSPPTRYLSTGQLCWIIYLQSEAPKISKLVNITPMSLWFMVLITIVTGAFVNQLITGGLTLYKVNGWHNLHQLSQSEVKWGSTETNTKTAGLRLVCTFFFGSLVTASAGGGGAGGGTASSIMLEAIHSLQWDIPPVVIKRGKEKHTTINELCCYVFFFLAKPQYTNWDTYAGPTQTTPPMRNCLREGYLLRSAYAVASAKVAATISLLDVMWSRFWFRGGIRRIGRWRFFGWLVKGRRKPHQAWSTLSWKIVRYCWAWKNFGWATGPQFDLRAYAFPTRGPTRSLRESPNRKWISENLAR